MVQLWVTVLAEESCGKNVGSGLLMQEDKEIKNNRRQKGKQGNG